MFVGSEALRRTCCSLEGVDGMAVFRRHAQGGAGGNRGVVEQRVQREMTRGLERSVQIAQYDDSDKFYCKLIQKHPICQQAPTVIHEY